MVALMVIVDVLYYYVSCHDNRSQTVLNLFLEGVQEFGLVECVQTEEEKMSK